MDDGDVPALGLLRRLQRDALPSFLLDGDPLLPRSGDHAIGHERDEGRDAELGGFLYDPIHPVSLEDRLSENDGGMPVGRGGALVQDPSLDLASCDRHEPDAVPTALAVADVEFFSDRHSEALAEMTEQRIRDRDDPVADASRGDEEDGHGRRG